MFEPWPIEQLGNRCYVKARIGWRGLTSSEYKNEGPFLIAGKHVRNGQIDWTSCDHITDKRYRESMEIALAAGDVILTKDGTIGRVARIDHLPGPATLNGTMMLLRSGNQLHYRFLFHLLNGAQFKKLIADKISGSSIPHIFQRDMVTLPISIPPMEQQLGIADVLDTLDIFIRQSEAIIEKLKQVKQGLLHDLLTRGIDANGALRPPQSQAPHLYKDSPLGWIPCEWMVDLLDSVADRGSGHTPSKSTPSYWNGGIKWVSLADSHRLDQIYISETDKEISELGLANSSAVKHQAGTVILSRDAGVGKSAILSVEMAVSQHFMAWRCGQRLSNLYLYFMLQRMKPTFESIAIGSTIKTIGLAFFKKLIIVVPSRSEQDRIVEVILCNETALQAHSDELAKLKLQKNGLMDDLLTGRVRVTPLLDTVEQ